MSPDRRAAAISARIRRDDRTHVGDAIAAILASGHSVSFHSDDSRVMATIFQQGREGRKKVRSVGFSAPTWQGDTILGDHVAQALLNANWMATIGVRDDPQAD